MRDSNIRAFGQWLCSYQWQELYEEPSCEIKSAIFYETIGNAIEHFFPTRQIKMHATDKPWITPEVKALIFRRQKAFKEGKTLLWKYLRNKVNREVKKARRSYYSDRIKTLQKENPASWYREIRGLLNMQHKELSVSIPDNESADSLFIANYINEQFATVAQGRPSLDPAQLPAYLPCGAPPPEVHAWDVCPILQKLKLGKAPGPDQLSTRVLREFAYELSQPVADILNTSFKEGYLPQQWKDAIVVPLPKCQPPCISKLRPVSLTSQLAKVAESFVSKWLLQDIRTSLDPQQYGCLKGKSTAHYMVSLTDHVARNSDRLGNITTLVMTDFSKAFDRIDHTIAITKLLELGARPSLIPWISNFLTDRRQRVRYRNELSTWQTLSCSVPQGTLLGPLIFLAVFDDAVRESPLSEWKFVDDLSLAESRQHNAPSIMQEELDDFSLWASQNHMLLNADKCKIMIFSFMKLPPAPPILKINGTPLEIVVVTCLVGVWLQSNLKWDTQVSKMISKANGRLFMLRSLKRFNVTVDDLLQVYTSYVRPVLEYCVPVWHPGLTKEHTVRLERIQKRALRTVLGGQYTTYEAALVRTGLQTLLHRREDLCRKFAMKLGPDMLPQKTGQLHGRNTRNSNKLRLVKCRTNRYRDSSIPYLVRLLNDDVK